ncbi:MAG: rnhB [Candidatus Saccharibacteria bacterium]|nr:rnhB [Candidatus Saccharibacteria bacterium]
MTTFQIGRRAEAKAAEYLKQKGLELLEQNWRTRYCEIDIVGRQNQTIYFIEVKYRSKDTQGTGVDYITAKKLQQMTFAAELWVAKTRWSGNYQLAAVEVSGPEFIVTDFLDDLS